MLVDGLEVLSMRDTISSHVLVSVAHVVVIVLHNSAKDTLVVFASVVLGFDVFTSAILPE